MLPIPHPELLFLRARGIYSKIEISNTQNMVLSIFSSESKAICRITKISELLVKWEQLQDIKILKKSSLFFLIIKVISFETNYFFEDSFLVNVFLFCFPVAVFFSVELFSSYLFYYIFLLF